MLFFSLSFIPSNSFFIILYFFISILIFLFARRSTVESLQQVLNQPALGANDIAVSYFFRPYPSPLELSS